MRGQQALGGVGEGLADSPNAAAVGRGQPVMRRNPGPDGQAGYAGGCGQPTGDQSATGNDIAHKACLRDASGCPVIMASIRVLNPPRITMTTWATRKKTRK